MGKGNSVEKCLRVLNQMMKTESNNQYITQLKKIKKYVKGEITSEQLLAKSDNEQEDSQMKLIVYNTINRIIRYKEGVQYYIELPGDLSFNECREPHIYKGETIINFDIFKDKIEDKGWVEITGDFSSISNGSIIRRSDWLKIISNYPNIYTRMYNIERKKFSHNGEEMSLFLESVERTNGKLKENVNSNREKVPPLPQQVIDSITFQVPITYLPEQLVENGEFGNFQEVLHGKYISEPIQETNVIEILKRNFKGVSAATQIEMALLLRQKDLKVSKLLDERAKLSGYSCFEDQVSKEQWETIFIKQKCEKVRERLGLPNTQVSPEAKARIEEINMEIEEIEKNWDERSVK